MATISATIVRKPRARRRCECCGSKIDGPHVRAFGSAETGDPPYVVRVCLPCARRDRANSRIVAAVVAFDGRQEAKDGQPTETEG